MSKERSSSITMVARTAINLITLLLAISWNPALAEETGLGTDENPDAPRIEAPWYDDSHDYVSDRLQRAASWFDGFFGDPRVEQRTEASAYMHVVFDSFYSGVEDESDNGIKFRGGARLPRLNDRVRLMITSDADSSVTGRELAGTSQDEVKNTDSAVGLRYLFRDRPGHKFSFGGGLSGGLSPEILLAGRYIYTKPWTTNTVSHVTSTLYWKSEKGAGVSTLIDYEWTPDPDTLWRYTLFGNSREENRGLEWSTQAKWARRLNSKTAINIRTGVHGETEPNNILTEGWLKFLYRRNFFRSWLYYEIEPGLSSHTKMDYQIEPTLALRLEIQFRQD